MLWNDDDDDDDAFVDVVLIKVNHTLFFVLL